MISRKRVKQMFTHYRKRLKNYNFREEDKQHVFRTTGSPCNCYICQNEKYNRKEKHKNAMKEKFETL